MFFYIKEIVKRVHIYFSLCWKKKKPTLASWWPTHVEISCFAKEVVDGQLLICLVPSRVSWSFCFLSHKTREVHISCPGKNQTNKIHRFNDTWHTYSDIDRALNITRTYVCPGLSFLSLIYSPVTAAHPLVSLATWVFLRTCFWSSQLQWSLLMLLQLALMDNARFCVFSFTCTSSRIILSSDCFFFFANPSL